MPKKLKISDVVQYVEQNIGDFHQKRIESLDKLKLKDVLKRKNPYLYKAKAVVTPADIVRAITDAHLSSNEETVLGNWLEGLAIFINSKVYSGRKSGIPHVDLEFDHDGKRYIVNIKSGPNWGNKEQVAALREGFRKAKRTLRTSGSNLEIVAVNGCCYGRDNKPDKGEYFKYCGQRFWTFISGDETLYTAIIEPLGHKAREKNDEFNTIYGMAITRFTREFDEEFCLESGAINWEKIVEMNSSTKPLPRATRIKEPKNQ